jgi:nicotinamidase-related amidase
MTNVDKARTALLLMDFQTAILGMSGEAAASAVEPAAAVLAAARAGGVMVIHVCLGFRPGYPEANPSNERFAQIQKTGLFVTDRPGSDVHPSLAPQANEVVVIKHRVGAFTSTDLDMILRAKSIDTLVLAGISTSGIVLSTLRHAADADYRVLVVKDACADRDPEVHRVLTEKVFAMQATVLGSAEVVAAFA